MVLSWVEEELEDVDLADRRLNERMGIVLSSLSKRPLLSIPASCGGYAEMKATYRFFSNEKVTFESVLEPHIESTKSRMGKSSVVLLVQDTTEIDVTRPQQQVEECGYLDRKRRGLLLHNLHAFTPDGTPLGTIGGEILRKGGQKKTLAKSRKYKKLPIEKKESHRWLSGIRTAQEICEELPDVQCVCIADSECDIYEVLSESPEKAKGVDWLIRSCQDRKVVGGKRAQSYLKEEVLRAPVLFEQDLIIRSKHDKKIGCDNRKRRQNRKNAKACVKLVPRQSLFKHPIEKTVNFQPLMLMLFWCAKKIPRKENGESNGYFSQLFVSMMTLMCRRLSSTIALDG